MSTLNLEPSQSPRPRSSNCPPARQLVVALGELLRDSLEDRGELRSLGQEVEWLRRYAQIFEIRHRGRVHYRLRALIVEDEWPAREYLVELLVASKCVDVVAAVATATQAREALGSGGVETDVAFIDINLAAPRGRTAGLDIVRDFAKKPGAPLFVLATALEQHGGKVFEHEMRAARRAFVATMEKSCGSGPGNDR